MSLTRIGFDATAAVTQGGGIGRYTRELLDALLKIDGRYQYRIFAARSPEPFSFSHGIRSGRHISYRQIPLSPRWLYRMWYRLRLPVPVQLFTGKVDLFHSPDFVLPPVLSQVPTLLTVHDLSFAYFPETFTPSLVNYLNRVVPWSVKRASHVLADSKSTKHDLISLYQTPKEKITVLYSGVDELFRPITDENELSRVREKYALGAEPYVFTVSTLQPRKNHQMLIKAFRDVAASVQYNLIIAGGKGWLYEQMLEEVRRQNLADRVRFIGFVDEQDLPALYSASAMFVFPSLYEGFGLPILEAMACGVPVLASDASSLPEVAGNAAMLLSPHNQAHWTAAMLKLVEDVELRTRLIDAGLVQARHFRWQDSARQLLSIYEQLLAR